MTNVHETPEPDRLGQIHYQRLASFRYALRRFLAFSETAARGAGLTAQQHQALLAIKGAASPAAATVGYLADQLLLQPNSAAELTDRMVKAGLLGRGAAPDDRRRVVLSLTDTAEDILRRLTADHVRELRGAAPALEELLPLLRTPIPKAGGVA